MMTVQAIRLRVQAHAAELSRSVVNQRVDQIRNRLAYLVANVELLCELLEEDQ